MTGVDDEKAVLWEFLTYQRGVVHDIVAGLSDDALRTVVLPSGWSPLGMVEHLGHAERHWFQDIFTGESAPLPWPEDDAPPLTTPRPPEVVFDFYRAQCRISDEIIAAAPLTAAPVGRHHDEPLAAQTTDLRRIMLHLIEETARHAGHLDTARELIDGRTGLGPR
ncbi:putative damage-inducible protein DinB [Catenuloplanes atrovinosus]|uniref:Damage-inducible protein DinB n=2 Tax=Catenuloplanes atrovinosus TaxID=137266 RepID=A0AAE3YMX5_9ACTN|nr:putative damage-inducible protein DinB [Catenuloplanes atrovinosus]